MRRQSTVRRAQELCGLANIEQRRVGGDVRQRVLQHRSDFNKRALMLPQSSKADDRAQDQESRVLRPRDLHGAVERRCPFLHVLRAARSKKPSPCSRFPTVF
jgi:hypothetical protein